MPLFSKETTGILGKCIISVQTYLSGFLHCPCALQTGYHTRDATSTESCIGDKSRFCCCRNS